MRAIIITFLTVLLAAAFGAMDGLFFPVGLQMALDVVQWAMILTILFKLDDYARPND